MQNNTDSYCRTILDAIPLAIFVVDEDVRVHDLNDAAKTTFGLEPAAVLMLRGGEVLHCQHAEDVPAGCGRGPACRTCVIRNSVREAFRGQAVTRRRTRAELLSGGKRRETELLITTSPMPGDGRLALLMIEDISELSTLRALIPICSRCKKVRDDQQYWQHVESYFSRYIGVDFTHGICPACLKELYPDCGA